MKGCEVGVFVDVAARECLKKGKKLRWALAEERILPVSVGDVPMTRPASKNPMEKKKP